MRSQIKLSYITRLCLILCVNYRLFYSSSSVMLLVMRMMHVIDCLGTMIIEYNQHYRWVQEVKWNTVVVSRTDPIRQGRSNIDLHFLQTASIDAILLKPNVGI